MAKLLERLGRDDRHPRSVRSTPRAAGHRIAALGSALLQARTHHHALNPVRSAYDMAEGALKIVDAAEGEHLCMVIARRAHGLVTTVTIDRVGCEREMVTLFLLSADNHTFRGRAAPAEPHDFGARPDPALGRCAPKLQRKSFRFSPVPVGCWSWVRPLRVQTEPQSAPGGRCEKLLSGWSTPSGARIEMASAA